MAEQRPLNGESRTRGAEGRDITAGPPKHIIVERQEHGGRPLWKFVLLTESQAVLDYSFCSTRGMAWRMAKRSWRRAERLSKEHDHG